MKERCQQILFPEMFLSNRELALRRIEEEGKSSKIRQISDLALSNYDFDKAKELCLIESKIVRDEDGQLSEMGLFRGALYCLLSTTQGYQDQESAFNFFLKEGFDTPANVLKNQEKLEELLLKINYRNQKFKYIRQLAFDWNEKNILKMINKSQAIGKGREGEVELRNRIVKEMNGFGEKTVSMLLRMCGAQDLVPMDTNLIKVLYFSGYENVEIKRNLVMRYDKPNPGKRARKASVKGFKYLKFEECAIDLAKKYKVPVCLLQQAAYVKFSTYSKN